ncbi:MAG TPA: hypothetical protein PKK23_02990 [Nitrospirales bacterium]|nr:hypothetical protein [Nitrospirales bacterium]
MKNPQARRSMKRNSRMGEGGLDDQDALIASGRICPANRPQAATSAPRPYSGAASRQTRHRPSWPRCQWPFGCSGRKSFRASVHSVGA